jgi:hypothetical protein
LFVAGALAYTLFPRKMTVDQAGKDRQLMPSIVGHLNSTLAKPLTNDQVIFYSECFSKFLFI